MKGDKKIGKRKNGKDGKLWQEKERERKENREDKGGKATKKRSGKMEGEVGKKKRMGWHIMQPF